jgi:hypothetical protein
MLMVNLCPNTNRKILKLPDHDPDAKLGLVIDELPARLDQVDLSFSEVGLVRNVLEDLRVQ